MPSTAAEQISKLFISDEETLVVAVFVTGSGELHDATAARKSFLVLEELEVDDFADLLREEVLDLLPLGLKIDTMAHKVAVI